MSGITPRKKTYDFYILSPDSPPTHLEDVKQTDIYELIKSIAENVREEIEAKEAAKS